MNQTFYLFQPSASVPYYSANKSGISQIWGYIVRGFTKFRTHEFTDNTINMVPIICLFISLCFIGFLFGVSKLRSLLVNT